jgi:hypothetical protein
MGAWRRASAGVLCPSHGRTGVGLGFRGFRPTRFAQEGRGERRAASTFMARASLRHFFIG